ncbi:MAG: hypothetical protein HFH56_13730 [Lachnospiraceae bacterium]|nr:hypothetical protein [Lachnospiraceae bacterium]MCI9472231.1 hypothetical protein [Lachnospiraceae bacterium]
MMKMTGKAFAKKLFGARYERLLQTILLDVIIFWGLHIAGFQVQIAASVRILMLSAFTAGVMWQALSSKDNAVELKHMLMLPYQPQEFVFSYVAALGGYTVLTKTGLLLAVLLAVSAWKSIEMIGMAISMLHAVLMAAAVYSLRKYWYTGGLWAAAIVSAILFCGSRTWFGLLLLADSLVAVLILWKADGYAFYQGESEKSHAIRQRKRGSLWRYFFRYLSDHKNYLLNTVVMWCAAIVMPYFLREMAGLFVVPVGFAILSLNTPICILLSCDRDLEQAVRFLPGQKQRFCIPYCIFIFSCNMAADVIFLLSWQIQNGGVTAPMIAGAVFFALQSAVLSVLLEWFYPIRGWKIESDLWHHPRKYVVPVVLLLLAGGACVWPVLLYVLLALLAVEIAILLFICRRHPE